MTLKLFICIGLVCALWIVIILTPIVRERATRHWRLCPDCRCWHHRQTKESAFEPPMMPAEITYEICPTCLVNQWNHEKGNQ